MATKNEHALNTGFTLYLMRRQKHARNKSVKKTETGETGEEDVLQQQQQDSSVEDYEKAIKKIASFSTVEGFWRVYGHVCRPNEVAHSTDFHMFREGIKPVWEDPANKRGGKLVVKVKKGLGARYWESLLLAVIGEQFGDFASEVCGVVISIRHNEDVLSLWTRNSDNNDALAKMREILKKSLKLPGFVPIDYKRHDTAESAAAGGGGYSQAAGSTASGNPNASGGGGGAGRGWGRSGGDRGGRWTGE